MYVILTSKPGQFRTEIIDGLRPIETYEYRMFGQRKALFVIAELLTETKVRVIDETPPAVVNCVPTKFFEHFATVERARRELAHLLPRGELDVELQKIEGELK